MHGYMMVYKIYMFVYCISVYVFAYALLDGGYFMIHLDRHRGVANVWIGVTRPGKHTKNYWK